MSEANKLTLLVLNDIDDTNIGNDNIDIVSLPRFENRDFNRIGSWEQHIELWAKNMIPAFDLLMIDINFVEDERAPNYRSVKSSETRSTPFGLMHALPLVASRMQSRMPLVWRVYSGNASAVCDDPVAIWTWGMLQGMQGDLAWKNLTQTSEDYFSNQIRDLVFDSPAVTLPGMVREYRDKLLLACDEMHVSLYDYEVTDAIARVNNIVSPGGLEELGGAVLRIEARETTQRRLRSLFADIPWTLESVESVVKPYLQELENFATQGESLYDQIVKALRLVKPPTDDVPGHTINDVVRQNNKMRSTIQLGAIVFLYLNWLAATGIPPKVADIIAGLGYDDPGQASVIAKRILEKAGIKMRLSDYLESLRTEPLEQSGLKRAAQKHWRALMDHSAQAVGSRLGRHKVVAEPACLGRGRA